MSNPYQAPAAAVQDISAVDIDTPYQPQIFSTQGRIGRLRYLVYTFVVQLLLLLLCGLVSALLLPSLRGQGSSFAGPLLLAAYIPILAAMLVMAKRRLNDINLTGWLGLVMLVPLVNVIMGLVLLFWPGNKGPNRFGSRPASNGIMLVVFGLLLPLALVGVLAAVAIPAYQGYVARAAAHAQQMPPDAHP